MKDKNVITIGALLLLVVLGILLYFNLGDKDKGYQNFEELNENEVEGEDYTIHFEETHSDVLLLAIHGGGIEPGTTELIKELAKNNDYAYYSFNGIKKSGNRSMHLTSTRYDEPKALEMISNSSITLSVHGYDDELEKHTFIGGLDKELADQVKLALQDVGFSASLALKNLAGLKKDNIVNQNKQGKGVQIEISTAQREKFFKDNNLASENRKQPEDDFYHYINAIESVLNND